MKEEKWGSICRVGGDEEKSFKDGMSHGISADGSSPVEMENW